ncbi:NOD3 protein [Pelomyxa schiedti]|nr:NOD3 protein [Pelomyxa schiedti]
MASANEGGDCGGSGENGDYGIYGRVCGEGWSLVSTVPRSCDVMLDEGFSETYAENLCLAVLQYSKALPFYLNLCRNPGCATSISCIADRLAEIKCLLGLELDRGMTDEDLVVLMAAFNLHCNSSLLRIKSRNNLRLSTWPLLCRTNIISLELPNSSIGAPETQVICETLSENCSLLVLNLSCNEIGSQGAVHIVELVKRNTYLQDLEISDCEFGSDDCSHIFNALRCENHSILYLDIGGNNIGNSAADVGSCLSENKSLLYLNIHRTALGDSGCAIVARSLIKNNTLLHLDLADNTMGNEGSSALSEALLLNSTLVHLNLRGNSIGETGGLSISHALAHNHSLLYLSLSMNPIGIVGVETIIRSVEVNKTILNIGLFYCDADQVIKNFSKCQRHPEHKIYHFQFVSRSPSTARFLLVFGDDFDVNQDYTLTLQGVKLNTMGCGFHKIALVPPEFDTVTERWQAAVSATKGLSPTAQAVNTTHFLRDKCVILLGVGWTKRSCVLHRFPVEVIQLIAEYAWNFSFPTPLNPPSNSRE